MNLKLVYFKGCPNHPPAVELLNQLNIDFELICQDELSADDSYRDYASPTLLNGSEIVFGSRATGGGCSVKLPNPEILKELLNL